MVVGAIGVCGHVKKVVKQESEFVTVQCRGITVWAALEIQMILALNAMHVNIQRSNWIRNLFPICKLMDIGIPGHLGSVRLFSNIQVL